VRSWSLNNGDDDDDDDEGDDDDVQAPMFNEVEATFNVDESAGRLTCVASGEPAPMLYWIQPSGKATRYSAPSTSDDDQLGLNEAVLELGRDGRTDPDESGMYICVADNDAGNATLTVSLPSPYSSRGSAFTTNPHSTQARPKHVLVYYSFSDFTDRVYWDRYIASVCPSVRLFLSALSFEPTDL